MLTRYRDIIREAMVQLRKIRRHQNAYLRTSTERGVLLLFAGEHGVYLMGSHGRCLCGWNGPRRRLDSAKLDDCKAHRGEVLSAVTRLGELGLLDRGDDQAQTEVR